MDGNHDRTAHEIVAVLHAAGVTLRLDDAGKLKVGGKPRALAVWHTMAAAIENLDALVSSALAGADGQLAHSLAPVIDSTADTLESHRRAGEGAKLMEALTGGPLPAVPVARVETAPPPPPAHPALPEPPFIPGAGYYIDNEGFAWKGRRDLARARGERFTEPPPYRWIFGG